MTSIACLMRANLSDLTTWKTVYNYFFALKERYIQSVIDSSIQAKNAGIL